MIALYENQPVSARVRLTDDDYLRTRYYLHPDGTADITVGRGRDWTVLACKEVLRQGRQDRPESGAGKLRL